MQHGGTGLLCILMRQARSAVESLFSPSAKDRNLATIIPKVTALNELEGWNWSLQNCEIGRFCLFFPQLPSPPWQPPWEFPNYLFQGLCFLFLLFVFPQPIGVSNILASLGHTGRRRVVLGHTLNTLPHITTKDVLSKFIILCWAAFIAILGCMQPLGHKLDTPGGICSQAGFLDNHFYLTVNLHSQFLS